MIYVDDKYKKITHSESVDEASQEHLVKKRVRKIRYVYYEEFIHQTKDKRIKIGREKVVDFC